MKHEGKRNVEKDFLKLNVKKKDWYNSKTCKHKKTNLYFLLEHVLFLQQMNKNTHMEMERHKVQFVTLILEGGRLMVEYESKKALYSFINVPKSPKMH
jgi:hypothetical protein